MLSNYKIVYCLLIVLIQNQISYCSVGDLETNVDGFMDAFDDAYSTEINYIPTTEEVSVGNEIVPETSFLEVEPVKPNEEPVQEEAAVTQTVFQLGGDVEQELNEAVWTLAERAVTAINPQLRLVNVTRAVSSVTNKVERSLQVVVARRDCEGEGCEVSCRVELVSRGEGEEVVSWHDCPASVDNNEVMRDKRGAIGGFKQVDEAEAKELAEIAAQTLDSIDADDTQRVLIQVLRAQKQLVNGIMYHLTLEMADSDCKEGESQCEGQLTNPNICKILMQRLFSGEAPHNAQVIKSECTPISKAKEMGLLKNQKRAKRHLSVDGTESNAIRDHTPSKKTKNRLMGEMTWQNPNSDKIKEISEFALEDIDKFSNSLNKQKIVRIVDSRSQVVAGVKYFLKMELVETNCRKGSDQAVCNPLDDQVLQTCEVVVWDKPWEKFRTVTKANCNTMPRRAKRGLPGGLKQADVNDARVQEMAQYAVSQLDARSNSLNAQKLLVVKGAQTQVVAGTNYYLKLQLVETNCRKGSDVKNACSPATDKVVQECDVVVYDRPWENHREMTSANCSDAPADGPARIKRGLLGGLSPAEVNDARVQEMAQYAVSQLDARSNSLNAQKLLVVKQAQTQVVAGTNYYLKLQLVETNCRKGSDIKSACSPATDKVVQECDVVVYDRPWDKHREMTSANCSDAPADGPARNKRDTLVGGHTAQDKDSAEIQEMAQLAVNDLNKKSNSMYKQMLVEVVSAHTQVVSGINYHLKLRVAETECKKSNAINSALCTPKQSAVHQECDVTVWSRPWLKSLQVTKSSCQPAQTDGATKNIKERKRKSVQKRDTLVGGHMAQDKDSAEIQEMAQYAVDDLNKKSNSMYKQTLVEIVSAHTQVVAGLNYHLKLRVAETECKTNNPIKSALCTPKENAHHQECDVTVWSQPWLNKQEVTKSNCKEVQEKPTQPTGAMKVLDPSAPEVLEVAKLGLRRIDRGSNSIYKHALIRVVDAKVQTVAGKKYFLTLEIGESECTKNHDRENCPLRSENLMSDKCNLVVWDRPWLGKKEVLDVNCGLRNKRAVVIEVPKTTKEIQFSMFEEFKAKYNKVYANEEEHKKRFRIFRANLKKIEVFQENEQGTASYGPNMFADLTAKEFKQKYLGLKPGRGPRPSRQHMVPAHIPDVQLPTDFDWRDHNAVTPVKNQGMCGSCWAFSVTGNVEGQWAIKHDKLLSLSEQELVDCDTSDSGCNGGYMTVAYEAIEKLGGLETEDEYPYDAQKESCKFNKTEARATVTGSLNITSNETQIAQWLYANGPISIGINANAMQFYMGGVSHPFKFLCDKNQLDHGVLLVGFGVHRTSIRHKLLPYWLVKNSWGPHWGDKGYYRVYRGDGTCGVNQMASSAIVG